MHNSTKNWTVVKILPKSNRTLFLLKPFYKPHIIFIFFIHTHKLVFHPLLRGNWAWGGTQQPLGSPSFSQRAGAARAPAASRVGAWAQSLLRGTRGWLRGSSHQQTEAEAGMLSETETDLLHTDAVWETSLAKVCANISSNNPI